MSNDGVGFQHQNTFEEIKRYMVNHHIKTPSINPRELMR